MKSKLAVLLLTLTAACGQSASDDSALDAGADATGSTGGAGADSGADAGSTPLPQPKSVVWVGAHPDDEMYAAPWLASLCLEQEASCKFLVLSRGEKGNCKLPGGCTPDVASVRDTELKGSAKLFGAELVHWDLGDSIAGSPAGVVGGWADKVGGEEQLLKNIRDVVGSAERIVTFDPRHGDSCHHDHRAAGALAVAVARLLADAGPAPGVTLVASRLIISPATADPAIVAFDANQVLSATGQPAWTMLAQVFEAHPSQFTPDEVAAVKGMPADKRKTWLLDLEAALPNDPLYQGLCP